MKKKILLKEVFACGPKAWWGAAISLLTCSALLFFGIFIGAGLHSLLNSSANFIFAVLLFFLSFLLGSLLTKALGWMQKLRQPYRWVLLGALVLLVNLLFAAIQLPGNVLMVVVYFIITSSLLGAGFGAWSAAKQEEQPKLIPALIGTAGGLGLFLLLLWFAWPGQPYHGAGQDKGRGELPVALAGLTDPAEAGLYEVLELSYGSGTDKHRREYGKEVDIVTGSVDISKMVDVPIAPVLWLRNTFWGFSLDAVPLNAQVWYPEGKGPFPLVLIVHGNHMMDDFSEPGYDYLGKLLASRGYIVASLDQNFLNAGGFIEAILGGLKNENDARAYLLLRHLALWHEWHETEGHLFEGMVDTGNIGLVGHSRGGEAAAIAYAFNHLPYHPGRGEIAFDFGFKIKSVIAIAPSDGQFQPRRQKTALHDLNYLVLQGSADSDVRSFQGAMQYDRVTFTENSDNYKVSIYIHGANHGQFNTRWGRIDRTFSRLFLDRSNIMQPDLQELVAKTFISSFFEDTLNNRHEYRQLFTEPLFINYLLPNLSCHLQLFEGNTTIIADYEEDMDLTTLTVKGGKAIGENLLSWREEPVELGYGRLRDQVSVYLGWDYDLLGTAAYTLELPDVLSEKADAKAFTFSAANLSETREPINFKIILKDYAGKEAGLPLSHIGALSPAPQYRKYKMPLGVEFLSEPIFHTYTFLLSDFKAANPAFNHKEIAEISFIFDNSSGAVALSDLGFTHK